MLADIDLDLNDRWVSGPGTKDAVRLVQFKRDTSSDLRVRFWSAGVQVELDEDAVGTFGIKKKGEYDSNALVLAEEWVKTGEGATTVYTFYPEFDGAALAALLGSGDDDVENDEDDLLGMCEVKWIVGGKKRRSQTVDALIDNDVLKDGDGGPPSSSRLWAAPLALTDPPVQGVTGVAQVETATAVGTITGSGNLIVVINDGGAGFVEYFVPVLSGDTPAVWAGKAADFLNAETEDVAFEWDWTAVGTTLVATRKESAANNTNYNTAFANGTCTGVTAAPTSANTTAGVAAVTGTVATALGQFAIVTTTNTSGDFEDVWTCSNLTPNTWQPPGQIKRSPDGTLYRDTVDNTGIPSAELAYP